MADRTTKLLLLAIAAGLWLNLADAWLTTPVEAQNGSDFYLSYIESHLNKIAKGTYLNSKLC